MDFLAKKELSKLKQELNSANIMLDSAKIDFENQLNDSLGQTILNTLDESKQNVVVKKEKKSFWRKILQVFLH